MFNHFKKISNKLNLLILNNFILFIKFPNQHKAKNFSTFSHFSQAFTEARKKEAT